MEVYGEAKAAEFGRKHAQARKPLARFIDIVRAAEWRSLVELKSVFASADYVSASGVTVFNIGGNKYRLTAVVNFERQRFFIEAVLAHEEYNRRGL